MEEKGSGRVIMDTTHWGGRFPRAHASCLSPADFQWKYPFSSNLNRPQKALRPSQVSHEAGDAVNLHIEKVQWQRSSKKLWNQSKSVQGKTQICHAHSSSHAMTMSYGVFTKAQSHKLWIYTYTETHLMSLSIIFFVIWAVRSTWKHSARYISTAWKRKRWEMDERLLTFYRRTWIE